MPCYILIQYCLPCCVDAAYDVLSDEEKRAVYDRYGEEGLKAGGMPPPADDDDASQFFRPGGAGTGGGTPGGGGGSSGFGGGGGGGGGAGAGYTFRGDPSEFFANFTRANNERQRSFDENPFEGRGGLEEMLFGGGSDAYHGGSQRHRRAHVSERVYNVPCTLEELYNGKTKKMKVTRKSLSPDRPTEKVLEVPIKPGLKAGTRITYSGEGDEMEPGLAEDIVFVLRERKHDRFVREGNDLHYEIKLPLSDALCGFTHDIKMLDTDERIKRLNQKIPVSNKTTKVLAGEGMPISKQPGEKGDLILSYVVEFPTEALSDEQKEKIREALPTP